MLWHHSCCWGIHRTKHFCDLPLCKNSDHFIPSCMLCMHACYTFFCGRVVVKFPPHKIWSISIQAPGTIYCVSFIVSSLILNGYLRGLSWGTYIYHHILPRTEHWWMFELQNQAHFSRKGCGRQNTRCSWLVMIFLYHQEIEVDSFCFMCCRSHWII